MNFITLNDKIKNNYLLILGGFVFVGAVLIACIVYAALQGLGITDINPYASEWNDEVIYYKQIESVLHYGLPQGYFGYNESTATVGTFGAWCPVILLPYVALSAIFGLSPVKIYLFNILMVTAASLIYYLIAKPTIKQTVLYFILMLSLPIAIRYTLSNMVEATFFAGVIIIAGLIEYCKKNNPNNILIVFFYALILFLSLSRPYFAAFMLFPLYFHLRLSGRKLLPIIFCSIFLVLFFTGYAASTLLVAPYFVEIVQVSQLDILFNDGVFSFIIHNLYNLTVIADYIITSFSNTILMQNETEAEIIYFCTSLFLLFITVFAIFVKNKKKDHDFCLAIITIVVTSAILFALIILYTPYQGSRHLISIIIFLGLFSIGVINDNRTKITTGLLVSALLLTAVFSWFQLPTNEYTYSLPNYDTNKLSNNIIEDEAMLLSDAYVVDTQGVNWDNTVMFTLGSTNFNYLYYLPAGSGIQLVTINYVVEKEGGFASRYVITENSDYFRDLMFLKGFSPLKTADSYILYEKF